MCPPIIISPDKIGKITIGQVNTLSAYAFSVFINNSDIKFNRAKLPRILLTFIAHSILVYIGSTTGEANKALITSERSGHLREQSSVNDDQVRKPFY